MPSQRSADRKMSWWYLVTFMALAYNAVTITFRLAFELPYTTAFFIGDLIADSVYLYDLWVVYKAGMFNPKLWMPEAPAHIRYHRRRWRLCDLVSAVPVDMILLFAGLVAAPGILALFRLSRLLRLVHLFHYFQVWERRSRRSASFFTLAKLVCLICLVTHWVACAWFDVGIWQGTDSNAWVSTHQLVDEPIGVQYLHALYWAITTITTVGYGDITPDTNIEIMFTIGVMLVGVSMWAYVLGNVASLVANLDSTAQSFNTKVDAVKQYMQYRHIPQPLQHRVVQYYDYLWSENKAFNDEEVFRDLPTALRTEILLYLNREILEKVPFFKGADSGFLHSVVSVLRPQIFCPGDIVINHGEIGKEMYFINKGEVEVIGADGREINHVYKAGDFFGEVALLFSQRRTATVRARSHCDLFVLTKEDLDNIVSYYPDFSEKLHRIGRERYRVAMECEEEEEPQLF